MTLQTELRTTATRLIETAEFTTDFRRRGELEAEADLMNRAADALDDGLNAADLDAVVDLTAKANTRA